MSRLGVAVTGAGGRMGAQLTRLILASEDLRLVAATERPGSPALGADAGGGVVVTDALAPALAGGAVQVVIDFTGPAASLSHAQACGAAKVPLVVGSTGFSPEQRVALVGHARDTALLLAPNMSVGVNVVLGVAARLAAALGEDYDCEVVEVHHRRKKDAPSGTALALAEAVAEATGRSRELLRSGRSGLTGERPRGEIGLSAVRGGDAVGEHTVFFLGEGERVELTHRATDRATFAQGALRAARWLAPKPPGLYGMRDVLGLGA